MGKTTTAILRKDANGVLLVLGQDVFSTEHDRVGELMGITEPSGTCLIRLRGGEVVTVSAERLSVPRP